MLTADNMTTPSPRVALKNDLIIRAAKGEIVEKVPVWIMRQAGRYLPEFKEIFAKHDFFSICQDPELSCQLTLQPVDRFSLDAAIIFSDILVIPQALGMKCSLIPVVGPCFETPLKSLEDVNALANFDTKNLQYVYDAISLTCSKLDGRIPLIGFAGGPWTLLSYMVDGQASKTCAKSKRWLYDDKNKSALLMDLLNDCIVEHLCAQVVAGCSMVQVFETNAGFLTPKMFNEIVAPRLEYICKSLKKKLESLGIEGVPIALFCKGANQSLPILNKLGYDVLSLDWTLDPEIAREFIGCTIQGNLDPCALYAPKEQLHEMTKTMLEKFGTRKLIANLGHGIYPDVDPDHVKCFVDAVHEISLKMNGDNNDDLLSLYT